MAFRLPEGADPRHITAIAEYPHGREDQVITVYEQDEEVHIDGLNLPADILTRLCDTLATWKYGLTDEAVCPPVYPALPTIIDTPRFVTRPGESWVEYNRSDGTLVQLSVGAGGTSISGQPYPARMAIDVYPVIAPCQEHELSLTEARILRDLLNRPEVAALLDATNNG